MHTPSVLVATVALLSTFAVAEVERPKFYFPRQIKREVVNRNVAKPVPRQVTPATPKRQLFDGKGIFALGAGATGDATTTSSSASDTDVVTVVISSTVFAGDATTTSDTKTTTSAGSGILFGPGGILSDPSTTDTTTSQTAKKTDTTSDSGIDGPATGTQLSDATTSPATSDAPSTTAPDVTPETTTPAADPAATTTAADPAATTTAADPAATTTTGDNLDLGGIVTSIVSALDPATTTAAPTDAATTTAAVTDPVVTADPQSTTTPDVTVPVTTDPVTTAPVETGTVTDPGTAIVTPPVTDTATTPVATDVPGGNGTATLPPDVVTTLPPDALTTLPPGVNPPNGTAIGTGPTDALPPTGINTSGVSPIETGTADTNGTTVGVSPPTQTTDPGSITAGFGGAQTTIQPQSIEPTATNADTTQFVPTEIFFAPSQTDGGSATTTETGIPSALPKIIAPLGGAPALPVDKSMVQIGYVYALNYVFVVNNWKSQVQLFQFMPEGVADGIGLSRDDVEMHSLVPYDTTSSLGYVTTISRLMIPTNKVDALRAAILTPLSPLYQNPDGSINTLMSLINPAIDILPGSILAGGGDSTTGTGSGAEATPSTPTSNDGIFSTDEQTQQTPAKSGQVAGVAFAAVAAAAGYGAAMFFIARRYKRKRSLHRRASSINPGEMRQTGSPALMGGALAGRSTPGTDRNSRGSGRTGNSARTAQISAPMMAENSLGWN